MDKTPRCHYESIDHEIVPYSIMYNTNTSHFEPGETIMVDLVMVNKTTFPVTSVRVLFHGEDRSWTLRSTKMGLFIKKLPNDSLCDEEEHQTMMIALNGGLGTQFKFNLPKDKKRLEHIEVCVYWGFHKKNWVTSDYI